MQIQVKDNYVFVNSDDNTSFEDFVTDFNNKHSELQNNHLIIQVSEKLNVTDKDFFVFLKHVECHQKNNTTFIVVYKNVDIDNFPEHFNIVPSLQEAEDVLEMENIQRELGF